MKKMFTRIFLFMALLATGQLYAQTETNVDALMQLSAEYAAEWDANQIKVQQYATDNGVAIFQDLPDGRARQIVDIRDGKPVYYTTYNLGAANTTRASELWEGGSSGLNISGEGYDQLGSWDAGHVRKFHQEFTDQGPTRVTAMDGNYATHEHSTHVAGTMVAGGVVPNAKGMAYAGNLKYWQWSQDEAEMAAAAANGLELSNHSYGIGVGWEWNGHSWIWRGNSSISPTEDYKFGFYDSKSRKWDEIAFNAPNYLIVQAAANNRGDGPGSGPAEKDGGADGYDCIVPEGIAKNVMTVGAAKVVWDYSGPDDVLMSSFSGWGPSDDGRIKPDIVGKGVAVYSTVDGNNSAYASMDGTSMSSPNVTGSMALLQKHYQDTHAGDIMRSATLKGLVLHSADEAGDYPGPDYIFGWGLMNTKRAAQIISDDGGQVVIDELVLVGGDLYTRNINVPEGMDNLRVTICWTDPRAIPKSPQLNPRDPMLVNDLDLKIIDAGSTDYFPYKLDPEDPSAAATTDSKNAVDNVESVYIENPEAGTYTIRITHDGSLQGGSQAYSIIISGIEEYTVAPDCSAGMDSPEDGADEVFTNQWFNWIPANYATSYDVYFGTDGGGTVTPTNVFNGESFPTNGFSTLMDPVTTYYLQVVPRNNIGASAGCDDIYSFTTM
ncbi:MAG: peptidase S8, partial [Bacteroidetes bacterium]